MGTDLLNQQIRALQARAARYRRISGLLGDEAVCAKLDRLADELDGAIAQLEVASGLIATTVENSHRLWAGLSFDFLMQTLREHETSATSRVRAQDWREIARMWIDEAESAKNHPDKELLAARAFEIAQLAEKIARDAESKTA
jgi:hypothetical protein